MTKGRAKIGIFDSGLGGVTLTREFIELLPSYDIIYLADTARFPYGNKHASSITQYATEATSFLLNQGATSIVIACNTVCSTALEHLRNLFSVPFFDVIETVATYALSVSKTKKIGLIATARTIEADLYSLYTKVPIIGVPCPFLATLVEQGCDDTQQIQTLLRNYLSPMKRKIDTLILGCTHYLPLLNLIQKEIGDDVTIVTPSRICAHEIASALSYEQQSSTAPSRHFFTTSDPSRFEKLAEPLLGQPLAVALANIEEHHV